MYANNQNKKPSDRADGQASRNNAPKTKKRKKKQPKLPTRDKFDAWVKRANDGDHEAQVGLRKVLDAHPQLWKQAGNLAMHAQLSLVELISKGDFFLGESMRRSLADLQANLESPSDTPLEKLSVERVVAAWANLYYTETVCLGNKGDLAERKYWLKKQDLAHRQYLAATKSLMLVQTMVDRPKAAPHLVRTCNKITYPFAGTLLSGTYGVIPLSVELVSS